MKPNLNLPFQDDPELYGMINKYRISLGWTWKRLFLIGVAETIAKQGNNPDLVIRIADYLGTRR